MKWVKLAHLGLGTGGRVLPEAVRHGGRSNSGTAVVSAMAIRRYFPGNKLNPNS